jgi:hypothetical protein
VDKLDEPILSTQPWMSKDQIMLYQSNQAIMLFLLLLALVALFLQTFFRVKSVFQVHHHINDPHSSNANESDIDDIDDTAHERSGHKMPYTMVDEVQAYIPMVYYHGMETPLLCCDVSGFDDEYLPFQGDHSGYSLYKEGMNDLTGKYGQERAEIMLTRNLCSTVTIYPTSANPNPLEKVDFGDRNIGWMWVLVERARELKAADWNGTSDPRCVNQQQQRQRKQSLLRSLPHAIVAAPSSRYCSSPFLTLL